MLYKQRLSKNGENKGKIKLGNLFGVIPGKARQEARVSCLGFFCIAAESIDHSSQEESPRDAVYFPLGKHQLVWSRCCLYALRENNHSVL